jgi:methionyl-tRNA formyltransferase
MKLNTSPVKRLALQYGIIVFQPETLKDAAVQARLASEQADIMIVAAYGLIIPDTILHMPRYGCINIHASLLPRWRGAAPIQRALLAGDTKTGITIMEMVSRLDAGAMIAHAPLPITESDTAQTLHDGLASLGAALMVQVMADLARTGKLQAMPQDESLATYAHKLDKSEATIDWKRNAVELSRQVRAFNPFPVAQTTLYGKVCRIWMAHALTGQAEPGRIVNLVGGLTIGCGNGLLKVEELQTPGGKRLSAGDFLAGHPLQIGEYLGR